MTTMTKEEARIAANKRRGFASMTPEQRSRIARLGGLAAQASGKAHRWTSEEARQAAGRSAVRKAGDGRNG